jgi:hypothetical protein
MGIALFFIFTILAINRGNEAQRPACCRAPETQPRETSNINTNDTIVRSRVVEARKGLEVKECDCQALFTYFEILDKVR